MNEEKAVKLLVSMLRKGTTKQALESKAWDLSIEIDGWCEPATLVLS